MDQIKIGKFISELRKENNLTQEALGEKLGVTNKTVSRWENGHYAPDVEVLMMLSKEFNVSINELLSGERLNTEEYKTKAEENLAQTLKQVQKKYTNEGSFSNQEKIDYFKKKWKREHRFETVLAIVLYVIAFALFVYLERTDYLAFMQIPWIIWVLSRTNRMMAYIEDRVYCNNKNKQ